MAPKARSKKRTNTRQQAGRMTQTGGWVQVYTRLHPDDVERLRKAAEADERPVMQYLRRMITDHLDAIDQGGK